MTKINQSLRIKKFLFEMVNNSRTTSKKLGKIIRSSQQSISYLKGTYYKNKVIQSDLLIVDPTRLGFINVIVGINFLIFDTKTKHKIFSELKHSSKVISIQESQIGCDILIEYCVKNLSEFNKTFNIFREDYFDSIETNFIYPAIVKHIFSKSYLYPKGEKKDLIVCGDRPFLSLSSSEKRVLRELVLNPSQSLVKNAKTLNLTINSVSNIRKKLEIKEVIKQYSVVLNLKKSGIKRQVFFLRFLSRTQESMKKFVEFSKMHNNIVNLVKLIGHFDLLITCETLKEFDLLTEIRSNFRIKDYLILDIVDIKKESYIPIDFDE
jgi:DNA-binding Lrp family transcriptional regulator